MPQKDIEQKKRVFCFLEKMKKFKVYQGWPSVSGVFMEKNSFSLVGNMDKKEKWKRQMEIPVSNPVDGVGKLSFKLLLSEPSLAAWINPINLVWNLLLMQDFQELK